MSPDAEAKLITER